MRQILNHHKNFLSHVSASLAKTNHHSSLFSSDWALKGNETSVLFLLGRIWNQDKSEKDICLILNKRSMTVKQPGDLCCPGGGMLFRFDSLFARLLKLPGFPFGRWSFNSKWRNSNQNDSRNLALLFATALREGVEEMRLIPLLVKFLGPLPPQELVMFKRVIYPMAAWISYQKVFISNNEVEKVIYIPLKKLMNPNNYGCYRLNIQTPEGQGLHSQQKDFPCFLHKVNGDIETLWGATYRIVMAFLEIVFDFKPPDIRNLPVFNGSLSRDYIAGNHQNDKTR